MTAPQQIADLQSRVEALEREVALSGRLLRKILRGARQIRNGQRQILRCIREQVDDSDWWKHT